MDTTVTIEMTQPSYYCTVYTIVKVESTTANLKVGERITIDAVLNMVYNGCKVIMLPPKKYE